MISHDVHLQIGSLLFEDMDQIDLTGPFEVLSRIPNATCRIYGKTGAPVRDLNGLRLTPDAILSDAPPLDVLHVPGGFGQEALMEDADVLGWIRRQATGASCVFSVCTGALLCGAAGLLKGRRATTHWASLHLLPFFGAIPVNERVVVDGSCIFAAGVTAGIDGALRLAAELRGDDAARMIQLYIAYAPEPPFSSGTPETAPAAVVEQARRDLKDITAQREATAHAPRRGLALSSLLKLHAKSIVIKIRNENLPAVPELPPTYRARNLSSRGCDRARGRRVLQQGLAIWRTLGARRRARS